MSPLIPLVIFLLALLFGCLTILPLFAGSSEMDERR